MPEVLDPSERPSPSKPKPSSASHETLLAHFFELTGADLGPDIQRDELISRIKSYKQKAGILVKTRAHELLQAIVGVNKDNRTLGYSYAQILDILAQEFPEASTSSAALRWYVVHMWADADDEGLDRPKMPQVRPRSPPAKKAVAKTVEQAAEDHSIGI